MENEKLQLAELPQNRKELIELISVLQEGLRFRLALTFSCEQIIISILCVDNKGNWHANVSGINDKQNSKNRLEIFVCTGSEFQGTIKF